MYVLVWFYHLCRNAEVLDHFLNRVNPNQKILILELCFIFYGADYLRIITGFCRNRQTRNFIPVVNLYSCIFALGPMIKEFDIMIEHLMIPAWIHHLIGMDLQLHELSDMPEGKVFEWMEVGDNIRNLFNKLMNRLFDMNLDNS